MLALCAAHGLDAWRLATAEGADAVLLYAIAKRAIELAEERDERLAHRIIAALAKAMK